MWTSFIPSPSYTLLTCTDDVKRFLKIDKNKVILVNKLKEDREVEVSILVKTTQLPQVLVSSSTLETPGISSGGSSSEYLSVDTLTALLPSSSTFYSDPSSSSLLPINFVESSTSLPSLENQLTLKLSIKESFCVKGDQSRTTIVIVSLSVLSLVLLALLSLTLIILRRRKPYFFGSSSQVSPGLRWEKTYHFSCVYSFPWLQKHSFHSSSSSCDVRLFFTIDFFVLLPWIFPDLISGFEEMQAKTRRGRNKSSTIPVVTVLWSIPLLTETLCTLEQFMSWNDASVNNNILSASSLLLFPDFFFLDVSRVSFKRWCKRHTISCFWSDLLHRIWCTQCPSFYHQS